MLGNSILSIRNKIYNLIKMNHVFKITVPIFLNSETSLNMSNFEILSLNHHYSIKNVLLRNSKR